MKRRLPADKTRVSVCFKAYRDTKERLKKTTTAMWIWHYLPISLPDLEMLPELEPGNSWMQSSCRPQGSSRLSFLHEACALSSQWDEDGDLADVMPEYDLTLPQDGLKEPPEEEDGSGEAMSVESEEQGVKEEKVGELLATGAGIPG